MALYSWRWKSLNGNKGWESERKMDVPYRSKEKGRSFYSSWLSFTLGFAADAKKRWVIFIAAATTMTSAKVYEFQHVCSHTNCMTSFSEKTQHLSHLRLCSLDDDLFLPTPALPFQRNRCLRRQSESIAAAPGKREDVRASWRVNRTGRQEKHNPSLPVCTQLLDQLSSRASREEGGLSALSSSLADEKQCALFHYTVNPISCFTLCRRVAERGNEWDGMGKCWHKSHSPRGDTSRSSGYSWRILSN